MATGVHGVTARKGANEMGRLISRHAGSGTTRADDRFHRPGELYMAEQFTVVWTIRGETRRTPHSSQTAALNQAKELLCEHGCDLEISLHLSPPPFVWFTNKRMRAWCIAGFPAVRI
jgi:hypothetical protein